MANTLFQQHKRRPYTWTSPDGQYWNHIDSIFRSRRWRSSIVSLNKNWSWLWFRSWTAYWKIQTLKKEEKTTKPFRYHLNQILYTVEVTNRFKGLDMIEWLKNYGWRFATLRRRWWAKPSPRKCKKAKWLSEEALQIAEKRREAKGKGK